MYGHHNEGGSFVLKYSTWSKQDYYKMKGVDKVINRSDNYAKYSFRFIELSIDGLHNGQSTKTKNKRLISSP